MERSYERARSYQKKENDGKLRWNVARLTRIKESGPCVVQDGITVKMDEMERFTDAGVHRRSTASFSSGLVEIFIMGS